MGEEYQKKTRETLGKIIKKPPLTDKLLSKPPFRFLHDITTEVIRTTGFLNGLFTAEEMDSKNVSVKEDKMKFLQKIIDVVMVVSGAQLTVKPSKVVAGHEPEKTNELLQAIAKCINKNMSSDDAVKQVLTGKKSSRVQEKPPSGSSKKKDSKERSHDQRRSKRDADEDEQERDRSRDRRRRSAGREKRDESRENEEGAGEGKEEKERRRQRDTSQDHDRSRDRSNDRKDEKRERRATLQDSKPMMKDFRHQGMSKSSGRAAVKSKTSTTSLEKKSKQPTKPRKSKDKLAKDALSHDKQKLRRKKDDEQQQQDEPTSTDSRMNEEDRDDKGKVDEEEDGTERPSGSGRPPRPASAKGHRRRPADKSSRGDDTNVRQPSAKDRPARPPSARPAAPRVRKRLDPAEEDIARMESAGRQRTAPLIVDRGSHQPGGGMSSSDEDEQFLVQDENDIEPPDLGKLSPVVNTDVNGDADDEEHGGLVRKILETKKELETSASKGANVTGKKRTEIERTPVNEAQRRKERELVMREIEKLRASVQKLCRSAVPLGKIIDYIQEDMDSMQNELLQWKKENKDLIAKLQKEDSITINTIKPLQSQLQDLDRSIAAHMDMIAASKCNVIRNQEKIDKMISGVTAKS